MSSPVILGTHITWRAAEGDEIPEATRTAILDLCNRALNWGVAQDDVEFSKIAGGISNILVKVSPKPGASRHSGSTSSGTGGAGAGLLSCLPCFGHGGGSATRGAHGSRKGRQLEPVAVKVFGEKTELLIDREAEARAVVALSAQGFGPKVLALVDNGRIEQFLNCITLTPQQMCGDAFVPRIAALLASFHAVRVDLPREPQLFPTIRRWLDMARSLEFPDPSDAKAKAYATLDFAKIESELDQTEAACAASRSPVVWGHNDLLSGNLLVVQRPGFDPAAPDLAGPLTVIDFEYGAYTYRGFDWGNHFNEYAGFECDYTRYPDRAKQALFFAHYMGRGGRAAPLSDHQLEKLCAEADVFALASHLYWGIWAVVQARYSPIDFDYMGYHGLRYGEYLRRKEEFMAQAARVFGSGYGD